MPSRYHDIAGSSLARLAALSDGIFAVVMTLLVLDLHVPAVEVLRAQRPLWASGVLRSEHMLWQALGDIAPQLLTYFMSFLTLGIFWLAQQAQLSQLTRSNRDLTWIHLVFLLAVSMMPFSTGLLAEYINSRLALLVYWLNLLFLGAMLLVSLRYAARSGLMKPDATDEMRAASERRIIMYQALYAVSLAFCVISTYVSIAFLVLLQLNSAIGPRIPLLNRF
jgi:uncharacterized membrane protein